MRKWLIELRKKKKFTQSDLAMKIGITRQQISAIERGSNPSVKTAKAIARICKFDWRKFYQDNAGITQIDQASDHILK